MHCRYARAIRSLVVALLFPVTLFGQDTAATGTPGLGQTGPLIRGFTLVNVGNPEASYTRYLQSIGVVAPYPWAIRSFGTRESEILAVRQTNVPSFPGLHALSSRQLYVKALPIEAALRFNSAFPYGSNDGAIWAGRGFTPAVAAGFVVQAGPISLTLNPVAFVAQNSHFELLPNGRTGDTVFQNTIQFGNVDLPQRFGNSAYHRIDWGQSEARVDLGPVAAGVSNANMGWGPMETYEFILSGNAPGFAHVFMGTSHPVNIWLAHLHFRGIWGRLEQSPYSPVQGTKYYSSPLETGTERFASGLVAVLQPRGIPGLELGGGRFFHSLWPREGIPRSYITKPFQAFLKKNVPLSPGLNDSQGGEDNQVASAFARWVFPSTGLEIYGEYGREDHNYDRRDLVQEPDHSRSYGLGLRKVMSSDSAHLSALRFESINYQMPALARGRGEGGLYVHGLISQGHTSRGQLLGADAGVGAGAGAVMAVDRYGSGTRSTFFMTRIVRQENGDFYKTGVENTRSEDVQFGLGGGHTRLISRMELTSEATLIREFNRDFRIDAWNLNALLSLRYHFER